jgi:hypothetical protein
MTPNERTEKPVILPATAISNTDPDLPNKDFSHLSNLDLIHQLSRSIEQLANTQTLGEITRIVRSTARQLMRASGATFVLKEDENCYYVDEDSIWHRLGASLCATHHSGTWR